ncbi:MAG: ATP-binding cassette domain-containing protein, partial [Saccharofermentanales bacterium]
MNNILELKKINKIYGTEIKTQVLYDVDLVFEERSFNSIIGQSGSGKSTLLNIIGTLDKPTSGEVIIDGIDASKMSNRKLAELRNRTLGFVFQFHYLLPEFTALENVLMPYRIKSGTVTREIIEEAEGIMRIVGLEKVRNNPSSK